MSVEVKWGFTVNIVDGSGADDELSEHIDRVMQELTALEECNPLIADSAIGLNAVTGEVEIDLTASGTSPADAVQLAQASLRAVIHAAGGWTPDWETESSDPDGFAQYHDEHIIVETVKKAIPA